MSSPEIKLILGGPGCGKTTRLLQLLEELLDGGMPPEKIAYVAFTTAAAEEARKRARERFKLGDKAMGWWRTIHSLAFLQLGCSRDEMMGEGDWKRFSAMVGEEVNARASRGGGEDLYDLKKGERYLRIVELARNQKIPLRACWEAWSEDEHTDWFALDRFAKSFANYKEQTGKRDFTGLLEQYCEEGLRAPVTVAFIDEAQDLTALQWAVVRQAFAGAETWYVAGDDDQAIYTWAGADVEQFLSLPGSREVLPLSHRLPRSILRYSQHITSRITHRIPKRFDPAPREGSVRQVPDIDTLGLPPEGSVLVLARNWYLMQELEEWVRGLGYPYLFAGRPSIRPEHYQAMRAWENLRAGKRITAQAARQIEKCAPGIEKGEWNDARPYDRESVPGSWPLGVLWHIALDGIHFRQREYYISCLRRGNSLRETPRIHINTIHGVKGAEADHVILLTDMSSRTHSSYLKRPDDEHRVFYVGATRARQSLTIVAPQTTYAYTG